MLLEAPAGLGKTSLLKAAAETAEEAGFACLRARANELERDFAYGCVRQLLEPLLAKVGDQERDRLFQGAAALSRPLFAPSGTPQPSPSADSSLAMLHGLYWLLNNLSDEGSLALFVDDLQWSDTESLRFLNYLAPRLDGLPLAVLVSTRSGDDVTPELARLAAGPETTVLRPGPLGAEATVALCERMLRTEVAPEFAAACREATGGNPFFLEELLREACEQKLSADSSEAARVEAIGPAAIARAVLLRLSEAPPSASALVRAVAVLGDGAGLAEAARLAEISDEEAGNAADLLAALAILKPATGLEFAHPIVREAVYADLGSHARAEAHARAAEILAASGASEERIAAQIAEAEPAGDAGRVELLRRVAADALARGGPAAAAAWLGRALAEPPPPESRGEVLLELSSAKLRLGTPEAAIEELMESAELIRDPDLLTIATRLLGGALTWSGDADRAVEAVGAAIESVESEDRELALLLEADRAAYAQQASLDARTPVVAQLERHGPLAGDTPGERLVLASLAFERARASESESEAVAFIERALADGRLLSEQEVDVAGTFYLLVVGLLATDALDLADACLKRMLADAQARASIPAQAFVLLHRGWASLRRGEVARAESDARTTLELLTTHDIQLGTRHALGLLVEALIEDGELDVAEDALRGSGLGEEIPPGMANNALLEARGLLHIAEGRTRKGLEDLVEYGRRDELWGAANPLALRWRSRASLALAALGETEPANAMAAEDLARAQRWGAASGVGVALRATALLEGGTASVDRLQEAVEALERSPARLEHARALVDLGAALRRANRRAEARSVLEDGRRSRRAVSRTRARQSGPDGAARRRRPDERSVRHRGGALDGLGATRRRARRRRAEQPRDRPGPFRDP